jgi:hypothetical protein
MEDKIKTIFEKDVKFIEGYTKYNCSSCHNNLVRVFIVWKDTPPTDLMMVCEGCYRATRFKITEIEDLGNVALFDKSGECCSRKAGSIM